MLDGTEAKKPHELIDELFIETPSAQEALGAIEILRKHGTRRDCCECVLLAGPSRVGKSAVVDHYKQLHPESMDGRQVIRPALVVRLKASARLTSVVSATLRELGDPRPDHGTPEARMDRMLKLLERQRVEVLIYDEFQHLINSDTDKIAYDAGDAVKSLCDAKVCKVVLSGVTHAERVIHTNTQLPGRARKPVYMVPADWRDPLQRLAFQIFLNEIERALGLPGPSGLGSLATAHRIHHFARGLYGFAHNLVREALLRRYLEGEVAPCLTTDLLARAADDLLLREPVKRINAFRVDPPEDYDPAPMFESLKEPRRRERVHGKTAGGKHANLFD
jgi:hypothetical protein